LIAIKGFFVSLRVATFGTRHLDYPAQPTREEKENGPIIRPKRVEKRRKKREREIKTETPRARTSIPCRKEATSSRSTCREKKREGKAKREKKRPEKRQQQSRTREREGKEREREGAEAAEKECEGWWKGTGQRWMRDKGIGRCRFGRERAASDEGYKGGK
jgi:hypothetical protein